MKPALRRAIMRANSDYFNMPIDEQEHYRVHMPKEHKFIILQQLALDLFGDTRDNKDELNEFYDNLSHSQLNVFNETNLPIKGIGEDYIWLNESFSDKNLLDFETLYDLDFQDYEFQEKCRVRDFKDYVPQPYMGSLNTVWVRLFIDKCFMYGNLYCAADYVNSELDSFGHEAVEKLIPHKLVPGKNHNTKEKKGFVFDMKVDANGKEVQLDELEHRMRKYQFDRISELRIYWDQKQLEEAYQVTPIFGEANSIAFIFSDKKVLKSIRFKHFVSDFRLVEVKPTPLFEHIELEKEKLTDFLTQQLQDIENNFDPKIVKLRKKRKIIMSSQAIKDLDNLS